MYEAQKKWRLKNLQKMKEWSAQWRASNKEKTKEYQKQRDKVGYRSYKHRASVKGRTFEISFQNFREIISLPCHYCGKKQKEFIGIDRKDNELGYTLKNCLPCCSLCNSKKGAMGYEDFINKLKA